MKTKSKFKYKKMNNKGAIWLLAAIPAAFAGLLLAWDKVTTPKPAPGSVESIMGAIPIWGWVVIGLVALVLIKS